MQRDVDLTGRSVAVGLGSRSGLSVRVASIPRIRTRIHVYICCLPCRAAVSRTLLILLVFLAFDFYLLDHCDSIRLFLVFRCVNTVK